MRNPVLLSRMFLVLVPSLLCCPAAAEQGKTPGSKTPSAEQQPLFRIPVDVVVVHATVTDGQGNLVTGLTADDFRVYEDGRPQQIHTFGIESYRSTQPMDPGGRRAAAPKEESEPAEPRLFSIFIDDLTTARELNVPVIDAVKAFVENDLLPGDQVSIVSASGRLRHPFTTDRRMLQAEIEDLNRNLLSIAVARPTCPSLTDLQAQRIATARPDLDSFETAVIETVGCMQVIREIAESIVRMAALTQYSEMQDRNRTLLRNLRHQIRSLRHIEGRKNMVLFSDGFLFQELTYELQDVVDQALRAGVILNTIDARGLYVDMFDASSPIAVSHDVLIAKDRMRREDASLQADSMNMLAHDTGGIFHRNSNDLRAGLQKVSERQTHFYVLSYAAPSGQADGRYHKIKIEVSRPGLRLSYREGYYAPKEQLTFEKRRREDILEALGAPGNLNEIPIQTGYASYQVEDSRYEVELVTRVDIGRMKFVEEDSRRRNIISLVVVAFDEYDRYVDGVQKDVTFSLSSSSYSELLSRGFASKVVFRIPAGRYRIKTVVRESAESKMGSLTRGIEVP